MASLVEVLLLSGGMDSTAIAYWKRPKFAITIDYGQRPAAAEVRAAAAICAALKIDHSVVRIDASSLGSGDLAGAPPVKGAPASEWWPFRNQFLMTVAAMRCAQVGASSLLIGALKTDGFHADGRADFVAAMDRVFAMQEGGLRVSAPAIDLTAEELVLVSGVPSELLSWSHSCHVADTACGFCRGCRKHYETTERLYGAGW